MVEFELFGVPVTVHASSLVVLGLLGWGIGDGVVGMAIWLSVALVSLLIHEGGHAVMFRQLGLRPEIEIAGLGGVTRARSAGAMTPGRSLVTSLAGPFAGYGGAVLGLGALMAWNTFSGGGEQTTVGWALTLFTGINVIWSTFNLLPILPLDGGQAMLSALRVARPGSAVPIARGVSVVFAGGLLALSLWAGEIWMVFLSGLFLVSNAAPATQDG